MKRIIARQIFADDCFSRRWRNAFKFIHRPNNCNCTTVSLSNLVVKYTVEAGNPKDFCEEVGLFLKELAVYCIFPEFL
jgi:hypothetical protein